MVICRTVWSWKVILRLLEMRKERPPQNVCRSFVHAESGRRDLSPPPRRSKTDFFEREIRWHVVARRRGLHKTQRLHDPHRHEPEIKLGWIVARAEKARIVVMVVLKA